MLGRVKRPSPALIVAMVALVAALGGTAVGLPGKKNIDGNDLKKNVVGLKSMKNNSVGPAELKANSVNNSENARFDASNTVKLSAGADQASAPATVLLSRGPLQLVAKCYADGTNIEAHAFLRTSAPGAILTSSGDDRTGDGAEPLAGYVNPSEDEDDSEIGVASAVAAGDTAADFNSYAAAHGGTSISGTLSMFVKQGSPAAGDGPYGSGDRCIFTTYLGGAG